MLQIRGARQHNLRAVDLDLPVDGFVALCGPSGSGKSSLAFDTLHAEGQRRYLEALSMRVRQAVGALPRPDVDHVRGLPPTVALSQHGVATPGRTSLAAVSELDGLLQVLFGRAGTQRCPVSGEVVRATPHDGIVAGLLALPAGTRLHVEAPVAGRTTRDRLDVASRAGFSRVRLDGAVVRLDEVGSVPPDVPVRVVVDRLRVGDDRRDRVHDAVRIATQAGGGVVVASWDGGEARYTDRPLSSATGRVLPELRPALFRPSGADACVACRGSGEVDGEACAPCGGTGLGDAALAVTFAGRRWLDVVGAPLAALRTEVDSWPRDLVTTPILAELGARLAALDDVGLGHLTPGTPLAALSSGEVQRLRLAAQVGSDLSGVLFILDEPTLGLGGEQVTRIVGLLRRLVARGNGVIVVDHHPALLRAADRVIEFGPGPGRLGGRIVADGTPEVVAAGDTATGRWLREGARLEHEPVHPTAWLVVPVSRGRNLRGEAVRLGRGALNVVVGPSGAGKSALLAQLGELARARVAGEPSPGLDGAEGIARLLEIDAVAARRSRRSMPASYVGLWDTVRELLAATHEARTRALDASRFSLNVAGGRCEACEGLGVRRVELGLLPSVDVPCEVCEGRRFASDVLDVRWKGLDAGALLDGSADVLLPILAGHPRLEEGLRALRDVGLGYLPLGQPTHTLSGGEARRLVLARELVRAHRRGASDALVLVDEPTAGLHPSDVAGLHALFVRLARDGATVVVATHAELLADAADHVVRLGPGAGPEGGRVIAQGAPRAAVRTDGASSPGERVTSGT